MPKKKTEGADGAPAAPAAKKEPVLTGWTVEVSNGVWHKTNSRPGLLAVVREECERGDIRISRIVEG